MTREDKLAGLGLPPTASASAIESAIAAQEAGLRVRVDNAPTDALRAKYAQALAKLAELRAALCATEQDDSQMPTGSDLTKSMVRDLPGGGPRYDSGRPQHSGDRVSLEAGEVLADRYEIMRKLGAGGMGAVYCAQDRVRNEEVAIKVMLPGLMESDKARERFLGEAKISSQLTHPNIVNVFDVQQHQDLAFLTMELLDGISLREEIDARKRDGRKFSFAEITEILEVMCAALEHAHKHTIHRDIKPENIFLASDGGIKLLDFGLARLTHGSNITRTGTAVGTAFYMAPEAVNDPTNLDHRADQYSLGVLGYELLSGEVPAGAFDPVESLRKNTPRPLTETIRRSLLRNPAQRFKNITEFAASLRTKPKGASKARLLVIAAALLLAAGAAMTQASWLPSVSLWFRSVGTKQEELTEIDKEAIALRQLEKETRSLSEELGKSSGIPAEIATAWTDFEAARRDFYMAQARLALQQIRTPLESILRELKTERAEKAKLDKEARDEAAREESRAAKAAAAAEETRVGGLWDQANGRITELQQNIERRAKDLESSIDRLKSDIKQLERQGEKMNFSQRQQLATAREQLPRLELLHQTWDSLFESRRVQLAGTVKGLPAEWRLDIDAARKKTNEVEEEYRSLSLVLTDGERILRQIQRLRAEFTKTLSNFSGPERRTLSNWATSLDEAYDNLRTGRVPLANRAINTFVEYQQLTPTCINSARTLAKEWGRSQQLKDLAARTVQASNAKRFTAIASLQASARRSHSERNAAGALRDYTQANKDLLSLSSDLVTAILDRADNWKEPNDQRDAKSWLEKLNGILGSDRRAERRINSIQTRTTAGKQAIESLGDLLARLRKVERATPRKQFAAFSTLIVSVQSQLSSARTQAAKGCPDTAKKDATDALTAVNQALSSFAATAKKLRAGNSPLQPIVWLAFETLESQFPNYSGCRQMRASLGGFYPDGFEVVDSSPGDHGWASKVRHKESGIEMSLVPSGTFRMGGRGVELAERPVHTVRLSRPLYMGKNEVSVGEWKAFIKKSNSGQMGGERPAWAGSVQWGDNYPVCNVTWTEATAFCQSYGLSLPTEAEWERACRAGSTTPHAFGQRNINRFAWTQSNSTSTAHPGGTLEPNRYGLFNMPGNVWEWCQDIYGPRTYQNRSGVTDPTGPTAAQGERVIRGGSWDSPPESCRSAKRSYESESKRDPRIGFRPVFRVPG